MEVDESVDVMMWSCRDVYSEVCECDGCWVRPPGKGCRNCGMLRFTGDLSKCPRFLKSNRDSAASRRQKSRETGICTTCPSPAEDTRVSCRSCRETSNAYYRARHVIKKTK